MTIHGIERFIQAKPFRPFTLRESSGVTHRVASTESIHVLPKIDLVVVYTTDGSLVMIAPSHVTAAFYEAKGAAKRKS